MTTSLIISTYNRPDALDVVIGSVCGQTEMPDEIIIADDGSGEETAAVVEKWNRSGRLPVKLRHVWQEDKGFRLAMIRNRAIAASVCDYIIQIDGDAFIHPRFVEDHRRMARKKTFLKGTRIMLDRKLSEEICATGQTVFPGLLGSHIEQYRVKNLRNRFLRDLFENFKPEDLSALGCNMSFWREDAIGVNGYDEAFEGWGHEDTDFTIRLSHNGVKKRNIRYSALIYHLWHRQAGDGSVNALLRDERRERGDFWAEKGIDRYLTEGNGAHDSKNH